VFENQFTARKGSIAPGYAAVADLLPPQVRRGFLRGGLPVPDGMDQRYRDSFRAMLQMVKKLHDAGITIVAGTDAFAGFAFHRELELYAEAGIPPDRVLQLATIGAARVARQEKELGSIERGKLADMVLIDGDPTRRMSDVRRTALVVKDGVVYEPAAIYRAIGARPVQATARSER
jgi:imidazolonepropionase-like amidohydrolase